MHGANGGMVPLGLREVEVFVPKHSQHQNVDEDGVQPEGIQAPNVPNKIVSCLHFLHPPSANNSFICFLCTAESLSLYFLDNKRSPTVQIALRYKVCQISLLSSSTFY